MIADRRTVLIVERVIVRCDECPRQVSVYTGADKTLRDALADVGWTDTVQGEQHYCEEHS